MTEKNSSWSFITHITNHLKKPKILPDQKAPTLWPSEASAVIKNEWGEESTIGKCRRAVYFRYLTDHFFFYKEYSILQDDIEILEEEKLAVDPHVLWLWKAGELYEQYCIDLSKESGIYLGSQSQIYIPSHNVSGKTDIIVLDLETELKRIVEVKSVYGFGAGRVMGTPAERKRGLLGTPRESNLMQIGLYDYWMNRTDLGFGPSMLLYGSRDTGHFAEYEITTQRIPLVEGVEAGTETFIHYEGIAPNHTTKVNSGISIENILRQYEYVEEYIQHTLKTYPQHKKLYVPPRDYELEYSEEKIDLMYARGQLNKTDTTQYEKRAAQLNEGKTRVVKGVTKGDWQCSFCNFKNLCYKNNKAT